MPVTINDLTLFDLKEISQKFGLSIDSIRSYIQAGKLKGRKFGVKWYVSAQALEEYFSGPFEGAAETHQEGERETQIVKDPLIEELREVMEEKRVSANAAAKHIKTYASQVIKWLKYRAKPIPVLRKRIKRGIRRMKELN